MLSWLFCGSRIVSTKMGTSLTSFAEKLTNSRVKKGIYLCQTRWLCWVLGRSYCFRASFWASWLKTVKTYSFGVQRTRNSVGFELEFRAVINIKLRRKGVFGHNQYSESTRNWEHKDVVVSFERTLNNKRKTSRILVLSPFVVKQNLGLCRLAWSYHW